jgi:hypothetical protein
MPHFSVAPEEGAWAEIRKGKQKKTMVSKGFLMAEWFIKLMIQINEFFSINQIVECFLNEIPANGIFFLF